jgi:hypothetical protein
VNVGRLRLAWVVAAGALLVLLALPAAGGSSTLRVPSATFTRPVRADRAEKSSGQNEPQVAVARNGTAFVTWQGGAKGSDVSKTRSGKRFTYLGYPDPATPNSGIGTGDVGDVTEATAVGTGAVFWGDLGQGGATCGETPIQVRSAVTLNGKKFTRQKTAGCEPAQIDRPWLAAYTPPKWRGTKKAVDHTDLYYEYHDFGASNVWVEASTNGGKTWATSPISAVQAGSPQQLTSTCNTIPGGIAVAQRGKHRGRIYAVWETSDLHENLVQGCDYSQAEAFDHIFLSYSDDGGQTWTSRTVFNDPCDPNPPAPPSDPTACQDVSEIFSSIAVDDAGNVYVAYVRRNVAAKHPEYDIYVAASRNGGNSFASRKANTDRGTHYFPWVAAGGNGGVDVAFYDTHYVAGVGELNKPAAAPAKAEWTVQMSQSLNGGRTWTQSDVSRHPIYFGDICTTGIFCGLAPPGSNWGNDRILFDDFGLALGPNGGARIAWTDAHASWSKTCKPGGTVGCQTTHIDFACQTSGRGVTGKVIHGCGAAATRARGM